ncbi:putative methyltransferase-domain-containing protein [Morchella snyderi]|nr:putative methyltransferase-domain-containing protein [Morchella snyderi]
MAPALTLPYEPEPELESEDFHVLDLPAMYTKPSPIILLKTLDKFTLPPPSWDRPPASQQSTPPGLTKWLTGIIASPLQWISDEAIQEQIWESASSRLAERCGRTAMPSTDRTFKISESLELIIHEPTLTADNLGLKTWASSYLLSKRLTQLPLPSFPEGARALELGSGTGLVGLAAAGTLPGVGSVLLTDLPEIISNLQRNVDRNRAALKSAVDVEVLDWRDETEVEEARRFELVLAADPIYSPEHPALVAGVVGRWMKRGGGSRAVVEMPLRDGFEGEREDFKVKMREQGLVVVDQGVETGWDDWGNGEVSCWWSIWSWGR